MEEKNVPNVINSLEEQLNQRLEKLWRIFSWTSSILIAISGGVIVLLRKKDKIELVLIDRILISIVVIALAIYSLIWIHKNLNIEKEIRIQLEKIYEEELNYTDYKKLNPTKTKFGYRTVICLLGITSLVAIWLDVCLN